MPKKVYGKGHYVWEKLTEHEKKRFLKLIELFPPEVKYNEANKTYAFKIPAVSYFKYDVRQPRVVRVPLLALIKMVNNKAYREVWGYENIFDKRFLKSEEKLDKEMKGYIDLGTYNDLSLILYFYKFSFIKSKKYVKLKLWNCKIEQES